MVSRYTLLHKGQIHDSAKQVRNEINKQDDGIISDGV